MKTIPTAEEFLYSFDHNNLPLIMIEFAKLHVQKALETASQLEETDGTRGYRIYPDSIINAYPLDSIK